MSIIVHFAPQNMTLDLYNETIKQLETAGAGKFAGRLYHFCYGSDEKRLVTDVYDSMESFQEFGALLLPILQKLGIEMTEDPYVSDVTHIITA